MNKLGLAIQWRDDVERGEMITTPSYQKTFLVFNGYVSSLEMAAICRGANAYYECMGSKERISAFGDMLVPRYAEK